MSAVQTVRTYTKRFLGLGWARVFLILGVVLTVIAILNPVWAYTADDGGGDTITTTFSWTSFTGVVYQNGNWAETITRAYTARGFNLPAIAGAVGTSYVFAAILVVVLIAAILLFSIEWVHRLPSLGLLLVGLFIVAFALTALFYPLLTVPSAAATDLNQAAITGYWGSVPVGGTTFSWGAGGGWWVLVLGVVFGILGGIWPFLKSVRQPMVRAPPPREWQVER